MVEFETLLLILLGLIAGAGGGLLGIGGSLILIPGLVMLRGGEDQHLYQASAMIVNFFVVAPAVWQHRRAGAIRTDVIKWMIPGALIGAVAGVGLSELPVFRKAGQGYLQIALAGFLFFVLVNNLWRLRRAAEADRGESSPSRRVSTAAALGLVGLPTGLVGGLLGIGGGIIAVPAQQLFLRVPLRRAIANSAATILFSSVVGATVKNVALSSHGHAVAESVRLALVLAPSAMLGSWIAAARVHRWPIRAIRLAFVLVLGFCCLKLARIGVSQIRHTATSVSRSVRPSLGGSSISVRRAARASPSTVDDCRLLVNRLRKQDVVLLVNVPMQVRLELA